MAFTTSITDQSGWFCICLIDIDHEIAQLMDDIKKEVIRRHEEYIMDEDTIFKVDVYHIFIHLDYPEGICQLIQEA